MATLRAWSFLATLASATMLLVYASPAPAVVLEPVGDFEQPVSVTSHPEDPNRLFVTERRGRVVEVSPAGSTVLADLSALVSCCSNERGMYSIVLAADFASTGRFYAAFAGTAAAGGEEGDLHVDAFRLDSSGDPIREPILDIDHDQHEDHYGGQLQLGPDGHLYISVGDGTGGGDPLGSGQSVETLLGKILRIDPRPGESPPYASPVGNPFASGLGMDEIWAYGLRNPWRFSFDRATGDLVIGDVGQDFREEIDYAPSPAPGMAGGAGANYGWNCREGFAVFPGAPGDCATATDLVDPIFDYTHTAPDGIHRCSVIGGYVVRDPELVDLFGRYVYSDLCSGEIRSLVLPSAGGPASGDRSEGLTVDNPVGFGEDSSGRLYVVSVHGPVYRLGSGDAQSTATSPAPATALGTQRRDPRLRLRLARVGERWTKLIASASPCVGLRGEAVQLNRGGRRLVAKRFDADCAVGFSLRSRPRAIYRALLSEAPWIRSRRLAVQKR